MLFRSTVRFFADYAEIEEIDGAEGRIPGRCWTVVDGPRRSPGGGGRGSRNGDKLGLWEIDRP